MQGPLEETLEWGPHLQQSVSLNAESFNPLNMYSALNWQKHEHHEHSQATKPQHQ